MKIKLALPSQTDEIQNLFNHPQIIEKLGGFTMRDQIKQSMKERPSVWVATVADELVGAHMMGGRPQCHMVKLGHVGVIPEFRRQRVETSLYFAAVCQAILEGRRLVEDTIVGDNEIQHAALPSMGFRLAGELRHRTASEKSLFLYQMSLIDDGAFEKILSRVPDDVVIEVRVNAYTEDLWVKNMEIYAKRISVCEKLIPSLRRQIELSPRFEIQNEVQPRLIP